MTGREPFSEPSIRTRDIVIYGAIPDRRAAENVVHKRSASRDGTKEKKKKKKK